jgi:hypothetical protein
MGIGARIVRDGLGERDDEFNIIIIWIVLGSSAIG